MTQYESIIDATETWLEKWLLHEATEVYNYYSCVEYEQNAYVKAIWEHFLDYELGHLRFVADLYEQTEKRDAAEVLSEALPAPVQTAVKAMTGEQPTLLMDKLGERLAFERSGTRLYEALLAKHNAFGSFSGGPTAGDLEHVLKVRTWVAAGQGRM